MTYLIIIMIAVGLISGYIITSFILLKFPKLLHKKKQLAFKAVHISHRGGAGENIENTIDAFKHAVAVGTDMLELDCHLTKDGEVVVCHDDSLLRLTGVNTTVHGTNYKDFPFINNTQHLDFLQAHVTHSESEELRVPLLQEVYTNFPGIPINLDVKVDNDDLVKKISDLTKRYDREKITVWGSRLNTVGNKCYKENPNMPLFFSFKRVALLLILFYSGLLPFVPLKESCYEIVMPNIALEKDRFGRTINKKWRALIRFMDFLVMNRFLFQHLTDRGIQVYLWVLNTESEYKRALDYRATGIMTDFPTLLTNYLNDQNNIKADKERIPLQ